MSSNDLVVDISLYSRVVLAFCGLIKEKLLYKNKEEVLDKEENCNRKPSWLIIKGGYITLMLVFVEVYEGKVEIMDWEE